jgi:hypothetical protein
MRPFSTERASNDPRDGTGLGGTDNDTPSLSITNVTVIEGTEHARRFRAEPVE